MTDPYVCACVDFEANPKTNHTLKFWGCPCFDTNSRWYHLRVIFHNHASGGIEEACTERRDCLQPGHQGMPKLACICRT